MSFSILVTGANRGLGRGVVEKYLARNNVTVIATVRDPDHETAKSLSTLYKGSGSELIVLPLDSCEFNPEKLRASLSDKGIKSLDVVLCSAGILQHAGPISKAPIDELRRHVDINAYGCLALFQATFELLEKATNPRFVVFGSPLGSIASMDRRAAFPMGVYGGSKALVHFIVRRFHFEHPKITAISVDPGFVQTDMGNAGAQSVGLEKAVDEVEPTIVETVQLIDEAIKEKHSGRFIATGKSTMAEFEGKDIPW